MRTLVALLLVAFPAVAAPVPKSLKPKPVTSPDGVWYLVDFDSDGTGGSAQNMARDWVIENEWIYVDTKQPNPGSGSSFNVRDPAKPNERMWGTRPAVFEVDGDTLRACYAHDGRKELTECKPGQGIHYYVFTRAK